MITDDEVSKKIREDVANKPPVKTLRDEFAMAALTGLIVRAEKWELDIDLDTTVNKAFYIADRVMKAREK